MLFTADFTFAGAYFAAFLNCVESCLAFALVNPVALLALLPIFDAALQNFVVLEADATEADAEPATTPSIATASTAARTTRRRIVQSPSDRSCLEGDATQRSARCRGTPRCRSRRP